MKATIVCFGALRDQLPEGAIGNRARIEFQEGSTAREVAELLGIPERSLHVVLINGEQSREDAVLEDGDEVTLMPPFAGGG